MHDKVYRRKSPAVIRKVLLFIPCLLFISYAAVSQNILWSTPVGDDNQMKYMKIIGSDESDFYLLRSNVPFQTDPGKKNSKSRRYKLACYSQRMALKWEKSLAAPVPEGRILHDASSRSPGGRCPQNSLGLFAFSMLQHRFQRTGRSVQFPAESRSGNASHLLSQRSFEKQLWDLVCLPDSLPGRNQLRCSLRKKQTLR